MCGYGNTKSFLICDLPVLRPGALGDSGLAGRRTYAYMRHALSSVVRGSLVAFVTELTAVYSLPGIDHWPSQEKSNIYYLPSGQGVCVETCPLETNYTSFICVDEVMTEIVDNTTGEVRGMFLSFAP